MKDGLRINGEAHGMMYDKTMVLEPGGVDFYDGSGDDPAYLEAKQWIESISNDTNPVVAPEQALVVTQILEGIYQSAKTGAPVYINQYNKAMDQVLA